MVLMGSTFPVLNNEDRNHAVSTTPVLNPAAITTCRQNSLHGSAQRGGSLCDELQHSKLGKQHPIQTGPDEAMPARKSRPDQNERRLIQRPFMRLHASDASATDVDHHAR